MNNDSLIAYFKGALTYTKVRNLTLEEAQNILLHFKDQLGISEPVTIKTPVLTNSPKVGPVTPPQTIPLSNKPEDWRKRYDDIFRPIGEKPFDNIFDQIGRLPGDPQYFLVKDENSQQFLTKLLGLRPGDDPAAPKIY